MCKRRLTKMEEKGILVTQEGYDKLEKELDYLRTEKRAEIAEKIKVALGLEIYQKTLSMMKQKTHKQKMKEK